MAAGGASFVFLHNSLQKSRTRIRIHSLEVEILVSSLTVYGIGFPNAASTIYIVLHYSNKKSETNNSCVLEWTKVDARQYEQSRFKGT
jgi:hypothetical protein